MNRSNNRIIRNIRDHTGKAQVLVMILFFVFSLPGCIEPYIADIEDEPELLSIEASLIKGNRLQKVMISRTSSLSNPVLRPVGSCLVQVEDEQGDLYEFTEGMTGTYYLEMDDADIIPGNNYRLRVITPEGDVYQSEYETLLPGVPVDTVYYAIEDKVETYTGNPLNGLQFYLDVQAPDSASRFFRWRIDETYEYTSQGPITYFYWDLSLTPEPPEDVWGVFRCWITDEIQQIFLANTVNIAVNEKKKIPLHYVSTETDRLRIKYSLLVNQFSINEAAYNYFEQNKTAAEGTGSLYTKQPEQPITNFYKVDDPDARVLGYFWTATRTKKRIFVERIEELDVDINFCAVVPFNMEDHGSGPFPIYIMEDPDTGVRMTGSPYCFDCTRRGGTTEKPSFWE